MLGKSVKIAKKLSFKIKKNMEGNKYVRNVHKIEVIVWKSVMTAFESKWHNLDNKWPREIRLSCHFNLFHILKWHDNVLEKVICKKREEVFSSNSSYG